MRIWDLPPKMLCRQHLLGEHRELHAVWTIITKNKKGYADHPETLRWIGKTKALFNRHEALVKEMKRRGYLHRTPLDSKLATGEAIQRTFVHSTMEQKRILKEKKCKCNV
ncbi:MAG: pyrimidine dimer DNA glycosylase [Ignavibacteriae bacterium]|nr:pyrimidine dimer DNA glycosylase [Ignavibacteriota bacterium]